MSKLAIIDADGTLTDESAAQILLHTQVLECACPQHLLVVLNAIRAFQEYETGCIIKYPKDEKIHAWLLEQSKLMEKIATQTIVDLMKEENIIDDELYFCTPPTTLPSNK